MSPFSLIPAPYRLLGMGLALAAVAGSAALWHHGKVSAAEKAGDTAGYARGHAEYETLFNDLTTKIGKATAEFRAVETELRTRVTTAEDIYVTAQTAQARLIVAQRAVLADNGRLRTDIAAFAAGAARGSGTAPDTAAAASQRAATLGLLLAEALRADAESANDAESNADAVRALLAAWPTVVPQGD